ncbi:PCMD domain-containing protein [Bacteroides sp. AN502(2024)]|uniref:PCMD domain-containing protein n=1 Tax=Bacteroides sp. AN502(2024) TaxID=3160599 RepID=UPI003512A9C5
MKFTHVLATALLSLLSTACIQNEEPNTEADILKCILPKEIFEYDHTNYYEPYDESINAYPLYISVNSKATLTQLAPEFVLTEGATIEPASGSVHDFTRPVRYTVTSADGQWHRTYSVSISDDLQLLPTRFHFENLSSKSTKYHIFYEENKAESEFMEWASANQGYVLVSGGSPAEEYPTSQAGGGYESDKCVKLVTKSTGGLGDLVNAPLAAGNLFIGTFNFNSAVSDPLKSTTIGKIFHKKPLRLKGYYKYKAGSTYMDGKNEIPGQKDNFTVYGIFYRTDETLHAMDGYLAINEFKDPHMVALALLPEKERKETDQWTEFDIPFDYDKYGKGVDMEALSRGEYKISIVLSASKDGDRFKGAIGSTLYVDELELVCEE